VVEPLARQRNFPCGRPYRRLQCPGRDLPSSKGAPLRPLAGRSDRGAASRNAPEPSPSVGPT